MGLFVVAKVARGLLTHVSSFRLQSSVLRQKSCNFIKTIFICSQYPHALYYKSSNSNLLKNHYQVNRATTNWRWLIGFGAFNNKNDVSSSNFKEIFNKFKQVQKSCSRQEFKSCFQLGMPRPSIERSRVLLRTLIVNSDQLAKRCEIFAAIWRAYVGKNCEDSFSGRLRPKHSTSLMSVFTVRGKKVPTKDDWLDLEPLITKPISQIAISSRFSKIQTTPKVAVEGHFWVKNMNTH